MTQELLNQIDFTIFQRQSKMEEDYSQETKDLATLLQTFTAENESQQDQNSSHDNNVVKSNKRATYSSTKVKARNLLTNVAYRRYKDSDFQKTNFVVDIISFMVYNCNPTNLEIKLETEKEREMVKFLWDTCVPIEFTKYLLQQKQFKIISQTNLTYQKSNKIVLKYLEENTPDKLYQLKYKLNEKFNLIHYIYSVLYAKIYNRINQFGIKRKNDFEYELQIWRKERNNKNIGKDPMNYLNRKPNENEQKPITEKNNKNLLKRKMLEEKLEENTKAMKKIKRSKSVSK